MNIGLLAQQASEASEGLIDGENRFADVCFLIAMILFFAVAVIRLTRRAAESSLVPFGLAVLALGHLVL